MCYLLNYKKPNSKTYSIINSTALKVRTVHQMHGRLLLLFTVSLQTSSEIMVHGLITKATMASSIAMLYGDAFMTLIFNPHTQ